MVWHSWGQLQGAARDRPGSDGPPPVAGRHDSRPSSVPHGGPLLSCSAEAVWGYLRTSLSCAGRLDLMPLVDAEDLEALQRQLPLT